MLTLNLTGNKFPSLVSKVDIDPGDWLYEVDEDGQDYESFRSTFRNEPTKTKNTLVI